MKILLIGKNGQVGWELERLLSSLGALVATDRKSLDLVNLDALRRMIRETAPHVIVNAAAYTAVDKAESEPDLAMAINGIAPAVMAEEAKRAKALLVHYSTDYVFDGAKIAAYTETDSTHPLSMYGRSKLAGEEAIRSSGARHLILRTSWVYSKRGGNFLLTMQRLFRERRELRIVDDQMGAPTWAREIAEASVKAIARSMQSENAGGLYHLTAGGQTSWHGFAQEILKAMSGKDEALRAAPPKLVPIATSAYPTAAKRPVNSVLSNERFAMAFGFRLPPWQEGLRRCFTESA